MAIFGVATASGMGCDGEIRFAAPEASLDSSGDASLDTSPNGIDGSAGSSPLGTCAVDGDCLIQGLHCATTRGLCVECREDGDCLASDRPRCEASLGRCIGCRGDADCEIDERCEASTHACVERCSATRACNIGSCDMATGRCVECSVTVACTDHVCNGAGVCVECLSDADCAAAGEEPFCDTLLGRCVRCITNAHCAPSLRCAPTPGECRAP
jgi:hypothetical protein